MIRNSRHHQSRGGTRISFGAIPRNAHSLELTRLGFKGVPPADEHGD